MKAVSVLLFASLAAAAVIESGLLASRDNFARHLGSITDSSMIVERDNDDSAFEDFSLSERDEIDDLVARNAGAIRSLRESVLLQARDETAAGGENDDSGKAPDGKKNNGGKADGKATDGKKNNGKADGKATDGKKNNGKADGKATDGKKKNNGAAADDGKSKKNDGKKGKKDGESGKKDNSSSGAGAAAARAA